ncbi:MAG: hypothetical protein RL417_1843 [Pseudomonadota bacterium]|jgi:hypothetical protein
MTCEMLLEFHGDLPELTRTLFRRDNGEVITSVRGKTAGALSGAGSFQWTSAVRALSALMVRGALAAREKADPNHAALSGAAQSLASTLDYALSKQPLWTVEMCGVDQCSQAYLRRLFLRTNPERKYPGPVIINLNTRALPGDNIQVWWDGQRVVESERLHELLSRIEKIVPLAGMTTERSKPRASSQGVERIAGNL